MENDDKKLGINEGDDFLLIESGSSNKEEKVSWQVLQAFYNQITGKTERLISKHDLPIQVKMGDLIQLDRKINQLSEQYIIKAYNSSVTVFHEGDHKEEYSSFERFKLYDTSRNTPVERIEIKYEILKTLPKTVRPQRYTISILIISGVIAEKEITELKSKLPNGFMAILGYYTATVKINYVDYVVAKNYEASINEWIKNVSVYTNPAPVKILQKYSRFLQVALKYAIFIAVIWTSIKLVPHYINDNKLTNLASYLIIIFSALFFGYKIGDYLSYQFRSALLGYTDLTFIELNSGDKKAIQMAKKSRSRYLWKGIGTFILNILSSIITAYIPKLF